ncbi:putative peptide methionine sulfoxide reductase [Erysiphe neolycopersici]|uniref:peptide-methionine (S)-S-oxide reductase n=1 Tax=Erysiphe neolycopersici TaxID=212602 RepID=A0A420HLM9_9PEZI|nr:putative peptide methionine sulfoxide reductase [Erysiphe neolycopersici]
MITNQLIECLASFAISIMTSSSVSQQLIRPIKSCVNTIVAPKSSILTPDGAKKAIFAAGCFWGVENMYRKQFLGKGIYDTRVGYIGGNTQDPTYRTVSTGRTGHAEAVLMTYDPNELTYRQLVEFFYKIHDPTTINQQGYDIGTQYRSAIFYYDKEQEEMARSLTARIEKCWHTRGIKTQILPAGEWWDAEDYHQQYLDKNKDGYECYSHKVRKFASLEECEEREKE